MGKEKDICLQEEIEILRKKMIETANEKGFRNRETIRLSQQLDKLMNEQLRNKENSLKN